MTKKQTAYRPSQANQEYVTMSDGRKVRNTAYNPSKTSSAASGKHTNAVIGDIRGEAHLTSHLPTPEPPTGLPLRLGMEALEEMLDGFEEGYFPVIDGQTDRFHGIAKQLHELNESGDTKALQSLLDGHTINSIETEVGKESNIHGTFPKYTVKINSDDPLMPTSISTYTHYTPIETDTTIITFDENTGYQVAGVQVEGQRGINGYDSVTTIMKNGNTTTDTEYHDGNYYHLENGEIITQTMFNDSDHDIKLKMWRDYDTHVAHNIDIQTIHDAGLAGYSPVTYRNDDSKESIIAMWEQNGKNYTTKYKIEKGEDGTIRGVPGNIYDENGLLVENFTPDLREYDGEIYDQF